MIELDVVCLVLKFQNMTVLEEYKERDTISEASISLLEIGEVIK